MSDTPSESEPQQPRGERPWWKKKRWLVPLAIVGLFVVGGLASAGSGVPEEEHERVVAERDEAQERVSGLESELSSTEAELEKAQREADEALEQARGQVEAELAEREQALEERAAQLDQREANIEQAEEVAAKSTFGAGTYEVGVDIVPGRYHADSGSSTCYWEKMTNDANRETIENDLSTGSQVVTLEGGILFKTERCGTWQRRE